MKLFTPQEVADIVLDLQAKVKAATAEHHQKINDIVQQLEDHRTKDQETIAEIKSQLIYWRNRAQGLEAGLKKIRDHHIELNIKAFRPREESYTIRTAEEALALAKGNAREPQGDIPIGSRVPRYTLFECTFLDDERFCKDSDVKMLEETIRELSADNALNEAEEKIKELEGALIQHKGCTLPCEAHDILRAMFTIKDVTPDDWVYDIREREGQGWEGPNVKAWGDLCTRARTLLELP